jgi:hypothetical protein
VGDSSRFKEILSEKMASSSAACKVFGLVSGSLLAVVAFQGDAQAASVVTFDLLPSGGTSGNLSTFSRTDAGTGLSFTATPTGTTTVFNSNANGLCVFSNRDGCGIPGGSPKQLTGVEFSFNKSVFIKSFEISTTNICGTDCTPSSNAVFNALFDGSTSFGPFSFTQGQPSLVSPEFVSTGSFLVQANTPLSFTTDVLTNPDTGFQYRISSLTVEDVPGPLPVFGAIAAFKFSRKIRSKLSKFS